MSIQQANKPNCNNSPPGSKLQRALELIQSQQPLLWPHSASRTEAAGSHRGERCPKAFDSLALEERCSASCRIEVCQANREQCASFLGEILTPPFPHSAWKRQYHRGGGTIKNAGNIRGVWKIRAIVRARPCARANKNCLLTRINLTCLLKVESVDQSLSLSLTHVLETSQTEDFPKYDEKWIP